MSLFRFPQPAARDLGVVSVVMAVLLTGCHSERPHYVMGIISPRNAQTLEKAYRPLQNYLEKTLDCSIDLEPVVNYDDGQARMRQKKWDLAFATSQTYLAARQDGYKALVMVTEKGKGFYHSILVVPSESPVKTIADLKGKTVAFVSRKSASGFTYPMKVLLDGGISPSEQCRLVFTGSAGIIGNTLARHSKASAIAFDAGAVYDGFMHEEAAAAAKLRVVARSEDIPHIPVIVSERIGKDTARFDQFQQAFLATGTKAPEVFQQKGIFFDGFVPPDEKLYLTVADVEKQVQDYLTGHPLPEAP